MGKVGLMKSELKECTVIKNYWSCTDDRHRHTKEYVAQECINKHKNKNRIKEQIKWTADKYCELLKIWRGGGITNKSLGERYGVCSAHIRNKRLQAERLERYGRLLTKDKDVL